MSTLATNESTARSRAGKAEPAAWGLEHGGAGHCQGCQEESTAELLVLGTRPGTAGTAGNTKGPGSFTVTLLSPPHYQEGDGGNSPSTATCAAPSLH